MILGLGWIPAPRPYYIVYDEDFKVLSWFLNPLPDYSKKVKDALHVAKDKLKNLSFSVESMHKPTEVYINEIPDRSSFVWGEAKYPWPLPPFIVLTPDIADDDLREAAGHELFHVVQSLYGNNYLWLMEASSAWFEAKVSKDVDFYPGKVEGNKNFIYRSLENGDNTKDSRRHG